MEKRVTHSSIPETRINSQDGNRTVHKPDHSQNYVDLVKQELRGFCLHVFLCRFCALNSPYYTDINVSRQRVNKIPLN